MQGSRSSCKSICRAELKPPHVSQCCASPPSRYRPPSDAAGVIPRAASVSTKEILLGTVSLGVGRVLFFYFFPGYPLAISRFIWLPGSGPGWRRQSAHCPGPVECGRMLLAVASPPPALGWLFCFHPCLGMSSLGIGAGGGGDVCFWGLPPALGEKVPLQYGNNELH